MSKRYPYGVVALGGKPRKLHQGRIKTQSPIFSPSATCSTCGTSQLTSGRSLAAPAPDGPYGAAASDGGLLRERPAAPCKKRLQRLHWLGHRTACSRGEKNVSSCPRAETFNEIIFADLACILMRQHWTLQPPVDTCLARRVITQFVLLF